MSEEAKVETADAVEGDPEAIFKELGEQERAAASNADEGPEDKGQADDDTPPGQVDTGTPAEAAGKTPPASEQADPWKDAPAPLRDAYEAEKRARLAAENIARANGGRAAQALKERDAYAAQIVAGQAEKPGKQQEGDETDEAYRARMKEEYPEFARLFDRLDTTQAELTSLKGNLTSVQTNAAAAQTEAALEEQDRVFTAAHPNWEAEKKDPAIQKALIDWATVQPSYVQDALRRNAQTITDGSTAADLISRFKRETADPAKDAKDQRRADQLEAARDTRASSPSTTKTGAAEGDLDGIWKELQAADARKESAANRNQGRR